MHDVPPRVTCEVENFVEVNCDLLRPSCMHEVRVPELAYHGVKATAGLVLGTPQIVLNCLRASRKPLGSTLELSFARSYERL